MNKVCTNKDCKSEGKPLPLTMFYKNPNTHDRKDAQCKYCRQKYGEHKRELDRRSINITFWKDEKFANGVQQ